MKVLVLGAGGQGAPCLSILARDPEIEEAVLADFDTDAAQAVIDKIGSPKTRLIKVDASKQEEVIKALEGMDAVIDMLPVWLGPSNIEAAVKAGVPYVSTSFDQPYLDQIPNGEELTYDKEAKEAGVPVLMGCGLSPGFVNVIARYYADMLDTVKSIKFRCAKGRNDGGKYDYITAPWNPGWSPKQALLDFSNPAYVFRNSKWESLPPFTEIEEYDFPDLGPTLVSHHTHEEVCSIPYVIGKGIEYCDFKYYVARQAATFYAQGFASKEPIEIEGGGKIAPIDFLMKFVPNPGSAFVSETPDNFEDTDEHFFLPCDIILEGTKDGKNVCYRVMTPRLTAPGQKVWDLYGTTQIGVAYPAVIGAKMLAEGKGKAGIMFPEEFDAVEWLDRFKKGLPHYEWKVEVTEN